MSEKKPQAGEFWLTRGGERRYVIGRMPAGIHTRYPLISVDDCQSKESHTNEGKVLCETEESDDDLVEHLPWCTSFDDPEPVAEVWPKYFEAYDEWNAFVRCERNGSNFAVRRDGTGEVLAMMDYQYFSGRKQLTEAEALARLQPPAPTCPDCSEPLTDGHEDVCPMAWVEITDPEHVLRATDELNSISNGKDDTVGWVSCVNLRLVGEKFRAHKSWAYCRARRKDLPPLPAPQPSTPDPGEGWRLLKRGEVIERGDEWEANNNGVWINAGLIGNKVDSGHYRRRITLDSGSDAFIVLSDADVILGSDERDYVKNGSHENEWSSISFALPWSVGKTVRELKNDERLKRYGNIVIRRRITPAPCICPQPGVVALDCPTDGLGHGFSEPDTVPVRLFIDAVEHSVYANTSGARGNYDVEILIVGNEFRVRKAVQG